MLCGKKLKIVFETSLSAHNNNFNIYMHIATRIPYGYCVVEKHVSIMGIKDF